MRRTQLQRSVQFSTLSGPACSFWPRIRCSCLVGHWIRQSYKDGYSKMHGTSCSFHHWHFRRCDVELEEQRLGLLDQLRYCRHRGYRLYLFRPRSWLYARLAQHSGPGILGASDDFRDNRSTDANQRRATDFYERQYRKLRLGAATAFPRLSG